MFSYRCIQLVLRNKQMKFYQLDLNLNALRELSKKK